MLLFAFREPLLEGAARTWIVSGNDSPYDVGIVPGGGLDTRPFAAAEFHRAGKIESIVTFRTEVGPIEALGLKPPSHEMTLDILRTLEVPSDRVIVIGSEVTSTWDEVNAVRDWAVENEIRSFVVFTEIFPSRRVAWSYRRVFRDTGITVDVHAITPSTYGVDDWWRSEQGLIAFQNEVVKYLFYLFNHRDEAND